MSGQLNLVTLGFIAFTLLSGNAHAEQKSKTLTCNVYATLDSAVGDYAEQTRVKIDELSGDAVAESTISDLNSDYQIRFKKVAHGMFVSAQTQPNSGVLFLQVGYSGTEDQDVDLSLYNQGKTNQDIPLTAANHLATNIWKNKFTIKDYSVVEHGTKFSQYVATEVDCYVH